VGIEDILFSSEAVVAGLSRLQHDGWRHELQVVYGWVWHRADEPYSPQPGDLVVTGDDSADWPGVCTPNGILVLAPDGRTVEEIGDLRIKGYLRRHPQLSGSE